MWCQLRHHSAPLPSALQTGQIQALTALACGDGLSPDAAVTVLPFCTLLTISCQHLFRKREERNLLTLLPDRNQELSSKHVSQTAQALWGCQELTGP